MQCLPFLMTMLDACEKCKPIVTELTEGDELATYKLIEDAAVKLFYAADKCVSRRPTPALVCPMLM